MSISLCALYDIVGPEIYLYGSDETVRGRAVKRPLYGMSYTHGNGDGRNKA